MEYPDEMLSIRTANVSIPVSSDCFGIKHIGHFPLWGTFLEKVVGFDTIVINNAIYLSGGKGYLYNECTKDTYNLNYASEFNATTEHVNKYCIIIMFM